MPYVKLVLAKNCTDWEDLVKNGYEDFAEHYIVGFGEDDEFEGFIENDSELDVKTAGRVKVASMCWRGDLCALLEDEVTAIVDAQDDLWIHEDDALNLI